MLKVFFSFYLDKVLTGTYNLVPAIWNSNPVHGLFAAAISGITQFFDQFKISSISQLISGIFKLFQKLLKCFTGLTTSVSFLPTLLAW